MKRIHLAGLAVALICSFLAVFGVQAPSFAGCDSNSCSQVNNMGATWIEVRCVPRGGGASIQFYLQYQQSSAGPCAWVYAVRVVAGSRIWCSVAPWITPYTVKWNVAGWNQWNGTNNLFCYVQT